MNQTATQAPQETQKPVTALDRAEQAIKDAQKNSQDAHARYRPVQQDERRLTNELAQVEREIAGATSAEVVKEAMAKAETIKASLAVTKQLLSNLQTQIDQAERAVKAAQAEKDRILQEADRLRIAIKVRVQEIGEYEKVIAQAQATIENRREVIRSKRPKLDELLQTMRDLTGDDLSV